MNGCDFVPMHLSNAVLRIESDGALYWRANSGVAFQRLPPMDLGRLVTELSRVRSACETPAPATPGRQAPANLGMVPFETELDKASPRIGGEVSRASV